MLSLSAALIRRILPELSEGVPRPEGLRTWLGSGSFYVEAGTRSGTILLKNATLAEIVPFISYDYERFALSSLESLVFCAPEAGRPQAIGWPATKLYYAAFFGAHSLMRGTGQGVLRVDGAQAARIAEIARLYSPALQIGSGTYLFRLSQAPQLSIDMALTRLADTGGAHDQFWRCFHSFLENLSGEMAANDEPEASATISEVSDIQDTLSSGGLNGGTWLSTMRNQLTYQHKHGVWFPFPKSPADAVGYLNAIGLKDTLSVRRDYNVARDPLVAFCACCHLIALVSVDLGNGLCQRLGKNSRFERLWRRLQGR